MSTYNHNNLFKELLNRNLTDNNHEFRCISYQLEPGKGKYIVFIYDPVKLPKQACNIIFDVYSISIPIGYNIQDFQKADIRIIGIGEAKGKSIQSVLYDEFLYWRNQI